MDEDVLYAPYVKDKKIITGEPLDEE